MADDLLESLIEDEKELNTRLKEGEDNGKESDEKHGDDARETDARKRIDARRDKRSSKGASSDESGTPQEDGGTSRGSRGDSQGSGDGTSQDAQTSQPDGEQVLDEGDEPPKDAVAWAALRREKRELEAKLKGLEAAPKAVAEPVKVETKASEVNPEPDKDKDLAGWLVWNAENNSKTLKDLRQTLDSQERAKREETIYSNAREAFSDIESSYKKTNPDYDNAINFAKQKYVDAAKMFYPDKTESQIKVAIDKQILEYAAKYASQGMNPAEALYDLTIERFGYTKAEPVEVKEDGKPNLKVISNNKKKSASSLEGGGQKGKAAITLEQAANMSPAELGALSAEDWQELKRMGF